MKKALFLILSLSIGFLLHAEISKTIALSSPGTLSIKLTYLEKQTITDLKLSGNINVLDFICIRDEMPMLANIDMQDARILKETILSGPTPYKTYPANEIPINALYVRWHQNKSLISFILPSSVTSIGDNAFSDCKALTSITIPSSVTAIGGGAFFGCSALTGITIPSSVTAIHAGTFCYSGLTDITIPNSVTSIGNGAFEGCPNLMNVTIPSSVISIGENAFSNCLWLKHITIPSSVISIGISAFRSSYQLSFVTCEGETPPLLCEGSTFETSNLTVYVPNGSIDDYKSAMGWSKLNIITEKHVAIDNPTFGSLAFNLLSSGYDPLSSITHLTITGNLNAVDISFMKNKLLNLTSIDISNATLADNTLPINAFQSKTMLSRVVLPSSLTTIGDNAFYGCSGLYGDLTIPNSVTTIGSSAYAECYSFSGDLTIPNSVNSLGSSAFSGCHGFNGSLKISNALTYINDNTFFHCRNLTGTVIIPSLVSNIGSKAFAFCEGITELKMEGKIISIRSEAFYGCKNLQKITVANSLPPLIEENIFIGVNTEKCNLTVPTGSRWNYELDLNWGIFMNVNEADLIVAYEITIKYNSGGVVLVSNSSVSNNGSVKVNEGTSLVFELVPDNGYHISALFYNGVDVTNDIVGYNYTIPTIMQDNLLSVMFENTSTAIMFNTTTNVKVYTNSYGLVVEGLKERELVSIYDLYGKLIHSAVSEGQIMVIPINSGNVYLVHAVDKTYKVVY